MFGKNQMYNIIYNIINNTFEQKMIKGYSKDILWDCVYLFEKKRYTDLINCIDSFSYNDDIYDVFLNVKYICEKITSGKEISSNDYREMLQNILDKYFEPVWNHWDDLKQYHNNESDIKNILELVMRLSKWSGDYLDDHLRFSYGLSFIKFQYNIGDYGDIVWFLKNLTKKELLNTEDKWNENNKSGTIPSDFYISFLSMLYPYCKNERFIIYVKNKLEDILEFEINYNDIIEGLDV